MSAKPGVTVMRSQLGRARGVGAAHAGVHHWRAERLTAIALVPLTLWFIVSVLRLLGAPLLVVSVWAGNPVNAALLLAFVGLTFHHMQLGLQVVIEDYVHDQRARTVALLVNKGAALVLGLVAVVSILKLATH